MVTCYDIAMMKTLARLAAVALLLHVVAVCPLVFPQAASQALELAEKSYWLGGFDQAVSLYREAIARDSSSWKAHYWLGRTFLKKDDLEQAERAAQTLYQLAPESAAAHALLGEVRYRMARFDDSRANYLSAIRLDDKFARAYLGLGKILMDECNFKSSKQKLKKAYQLDPNDPDIVRLWASTQKGEERVGLLERYLTLATNEEEKSRAEIQNWIDMRKQTGFVELFHLDGEAQPTEIKLLRVATGPTGKSYGLGIKVGFNDGKPVKLHLDTGASGIWIYKNAAEKFKVKQLAAAARLLGLGDERDPDVYYGWADTITIGALRFKNCVVSVSERRLDTDTEGIIGTDVFHKFLIRLSYPEGVLQLLAFPKGNDSSTIADGQSAFDFDRFGRGVPPEMTRPTLVRLVSGKMLMRTSVNDKLHGYFLIDSGASDNFISKKLAEKASAIGREYQLRVKGMSGSIKQLYSANHITLQFANFRQSNPGVLAFDFSEVSKPLGVEISGLLGHPLLKHFTLLIDYRDGAVQFDYKD